MAKKAKRSASVSKASAKRPPKRAAARTAKRPKRPKSAGAAGKQKTTVLGQPSWKIASPRVEAHVAEAGGHLGPITFDRRGRKLQPYAVAPWAQEKVDRGLPQILKTLRGDFFCMPFGGNTTPWRGEQHPVHGETANAKWSFVAAGKSDDGRPSLHLRLRTRIRPGVVDKHILLGEDHDAVYQRHVVSDMSGPMNFGHHAMLRFPDEGGVISTSPFTYGQVYTAPVEVPENRGYSILKPGATFDSLEKVPMITGETTDLTHYPARRGYEDLVTLVADTNPPFAWTAVTFPKQRFAWFALKDPNVLRQTIFWISNGGRHYAPWSGRHVNVLGLEEVTSYFHGGLAESVEDNDFQRRGITTHVTLDPQQPLTVNYIMGVADIPDGFDRVSWIESESPGSIVLRSANGQHRVSVPVDADFLR